MTTRMNIAARLNYSVCVLSMLFLTGCFIPWPHTSTLTQRYIGRVVDGGTGAPIPGAKIFLSQHTNVACRSHSDGRFSLRRRHNFHLGYIGLTEQHEWPNEGRCWFDDSITISHKNYVNVEPPCKELSYDFNSGKGTLDAGDVRLHPKE
jgi:hypothetical protein